MGGILQFKVPESKNADGLFDFFDDANFLLKFFVRTRSAVDFGLTPKFPYEKLSNVLGSGGQTKPRRAPPRVGKSCVTKFRRRWRGSKIFPSHISATRGPNVF